MAGKWLRVFSTDRAGHPDPEQLLAYLSRMGSPARGVFTADDRGWYRAVLEIPHGGRALQIDCYDADEEGIRRQLSTWAAWLEEREDAPHHEALMRLVFSAARLYTLVGPPGDEDMEGIASQIARFLAACTGGAYQADGKGFHSPDGQVLVKEDRPCPQ